MTLHLSKFFSVVLIFLMPMLSPADSQNEVETEELSTGWRTARDTVPAFNTALTAYQNLLRLECKHKFAVLPALENVGIKRQTAASEVKEKILKSNAHNNSGFRKYQYTLNNGDVLYINWPENVGGRAVAAILEISFNEPVLKYRCSFERIDPFRDDIE